MKKFSYLSGKEVKNGDQIRYHGELGKVEFVIAEKVRDPALDWYFEQSAAGGFMITANTFGNVFVAESDIDEDLEFVSRGKSFQTHD